MYQGHPFRSGVRTILESSPPPSLRAPVVGVKLTPDPLHHRARPKLPELESLLASVNPSTVRLVEIDPASQLDRVPRAVANFSGLAFAHVSGRRLRDYEALSGLREIKSLFVIGYREPTLWPMTVRALESFRTIGDSLASCSLSSQRLWFQRSKLRRFDGGAVEELRLENCRSLDHSSIPTLVGLRHLLLMGQPFSSLDFLAACPALRELEIYSPPKEADLGELKRTKTIERVTLSTHDRLVEEIGRANPRLAISSGSVCFVGGKPARHFGDFYPDKLPSASR
jgi:hypothetical protein